MAKGWKFEDNSKEVKNQMTNVSEEAMEEALLVLEARAKALAPVQTGLLRDSLDHQVRQQNGDIIGVVGSGLEYAIYVEYGTGEYSENGAGRKGGWVYKDSSGEWFFTWGQDPQPFLRPAFRRNKKEIQQIIGGKFKSSFKGEK